MKKLLLFILILFPAYGISAEYELVPVISNKDAKDIKECKYNISGYENKKECVTKDNYDKVIRNTCARQSGDAKSDFSAKKIYKTCLEESGVLDK
jgi:hypothetical protein